jgi:hypothetical protein
VLVTNTGGAASSGEVTITDELPVGLQAAPGISAIDELAAISPGAGNFSNACSETGAGDESCTYNGVVQPGDTLILTFPVKVAASEGMSVTNVVSVAGGGAASAQMRTPTAISAAPAGFGIPRGASSTALSSLQAGAHPDLTTTFALATENLEGRTAGNLKDVTDDLPPGFAGDLVDTPACAAADFLSEECPVATQVGVTTITLLGGGHPGPNLRPVYNLAPEPGEVAKLGFSDPQPAAL